VTLSDTTVDPGQTITLSAQGFKPGSVVAVDFLSTPVSIGQLTAQANGSVSGSVTIPITATAGAHTIRLTGANSDGTARVLSAAVTVSNTLPRTGGNTWTTLRIAVLLLGLGMIVLGRSQLLEIRRD